MFATMRSLMILALALAGCGGGAASSSSSGAATTAVGTPRTGPAVDLIALVPAEASVVLHANMNTVRQDPARYDRLATGLATQLGLSSEVGAVRALLDRTDDAVGVFVPNGGALEGMLVFSGRFSEQDFEQAIAMASARHGAAGAVEAGSDGRRVVALGNGTLVQLDTWTWAVVHGPGLRAHIAQVALRGGRAFGQNLIEFGPRIGLPSGSAQAWANQSHPVGVDMVALVFAGENPQMVENFVGTVRRHLGL
jgi:hypothetical protein